jgi:hypothetical protein
MGLGQYRLALFDGRRLYGRFVPDCSGDSRVLSGRAVDVLPARRVTAWPVG